MDRMPATAMGQNNNEEEAVEEGEMSKKHIEECVRSSLEGYFKDLRGTEPDGMYEMLVRAVEKPLLEVVMAKAEQQPVQGGRMAGPEPQHPAQETRRAQTAQVIPNRLCTH